MDIADYVKNNLIDWPNWLNGLLLRLNCFGRLVYGMKYYSIKNNMKGVGNENLLLKTVNNAIAHVPYYRKLYGNIEIHSIEEFHNKISFIDKDEVMSHWEEFISDDIDWSKVHTCTTGGTNGKPLKLVMPNERYAWELAYMHNMWEKAGWHYHTRGVIRNHDLKGRDYAINPVLKEIIFDPHKMSEGYAKKVYQILKGYGIKFVTAYPSNAYQFCKLCLKQGLDLDFINAFLCGSEGVTYEQKEFFLRHKIRILTWYGHSEKLILGSNDMCSWDIKMEPNYGYCEMIDPDGRTIFKEGELGELVGTTYYNHYFPLIRYKTGDYAVLAKCNNCLELTEIIGRWDKSLIYKKDGTSTSLTILNVHGEFYEHIDGMQYIQEKKGYIKVHLIINEKYTPKDDEFILNHVAKAMGGKEYVDIKHVDKLTYLPNGKFLPLISKIDNPVVLS